MHLYVVKLSLKLECEKTFFRVLWPVGRINKTVSVFVLFRGETLNCFLFIKVYGGKTLMTRTKK